jgi:hypothetical protein
VTGKASSDRKVDVGGKRRRGWVESAKFVKEFGPEQHGCGAHGHDVINVVVLPLIEMVINR